MTTPLFKPGFRIDVIDMLVLAAGAAGTVWLAQVEWWMGLIVGLPMRICLRWRWRTRVASPRWITGLR